MNTYNIYNKISEFEIYLLERELVLQENLILKGYFVEGL